MVLLSVRTVRSLSVRQHELRYGHCVVVELVCTVSVSGKSAYVVSMGYVAHRWRIDSVSFLPWNRSAVQYCIY